MPAIFFGHDSRNRMCFAASRQREVITCPVEGIDGGEVIYIDDPLLFVEVAERLGLHGIHHTSYASTREALAAFGLS
jgi:hypothetical protein